MFIGRSTAKSEEVLAQVVEQLLGDVKGQLLLFLPQDDG